MSDLERVSVLLQLSISNAYASSLFDRELERAGLVPAQAGLLDLIGRNEPVTPTALEQVVGLPGATVRARVRTLEEDGYVERQPNPADARSYFLATTPSGREFLGVARETIERVEKLISEEMGKPIEALRGPLEELREAARTVLFGDDPEALSHISPTPPEVPRPGDASVEASPDLNVGDQ